MANNFIQVSPDSTGKQLQTYMNVIDGNNVHSEAITLTDNTGNYVATLPVSIGSNLNVNGTVAATQSGTWNVGLLTTPIVVSQSNASNLAATVSGTVTVNAGINLNTSLLATAANQTSGSEKTQICDPNNASNVAGVTSGGLNVYLPSITANSGTNLNTANISVKVFQGGAFLASGQVANVSNVSTTIAGSRATRRSVTIRNHDSTNSGYIGPAPIGVTNGLLLSPLDSVSVDFIGIISGISATTSNVTFGYLETYD